MGRWGKSMLDFQDVRQMKPFKFMKCRASWAPEKLHGSLPLPPKKDSSIALGTECDFKDFTKMMDELRTKNIAQNIDYSQKFI